MFFGKGKPDVDGVHVAMWPLWVDHVGPDGWRGAQPASRSAAIASRSAERLDMKRRGALHDLRLARAASVREYQIVIGSYGH